MLKDNELHVGIYHPEIAKGVTTSLMGIQCAPVPCLEVFLSSADEEQGRGVGKPAATTQLESVSAEKLTEYLHV